MPAQFVSVAPAWTAWQWSANKLRQSANIIDGNYHIHWLEHFLAEGGMDV